MKPANPCYRGRYAPSPTGQLHKGSLMAALASFLQAKAHGGQWLMRMDNVDQLRVVEGAAEDILNTLLDFGLYWDGQPAYQSQHEQAYQNAIQHLLDSKQAFACGCTRKQARMGPMGLEGPIYPGTCRQGLKGRPSRSIRIQASDCTISLQDIAQGAYQQNIATDIGDFIIRRADGLVAYQLACVVDDELQGVEQVVRGADLLASTPRQIYLQRHLGYPTPSYLHIPVLVDQQGEKLGKSNGALALNKHSRGQSLVAALTLLGQSPPTHLKKAPPQDVIEWGLAHWQPACIPALLTCNYRQADWPDE